MLSHELRNPLGAIVTATALAEVAARGRQHPAVSRHPRAAVSADGRASSTISWRRAASPRTRSRSSGAPSICAPRRARPPTRRAGCSSLRGLAFTVELDGEPLWIDADPVSPAADPGQSSQQRRQVHAQGRARQLAGRRGGRRGGVSPQGRRRRAPARRWPSRSSSSSSSPSGRSIARAAGWAWGSRWCARSSTCTAGPSRCTATGKARAASSWSDFPCRTGEGHDRRAARQAAPGPVRGSLREGATIVVVEDQADSREALCELLSQEGFACRTAENGSEGLALIDEVMPDVAILDVGLPGMDGFEMARAAALRSRATPACSSSPSPATGRPPSGRAARGRLRRAPRQAGERRGVPAAAERAEGPPAGSGGVLIGRQPGGSATCCRRCLACLGLRLRRPDRRRRRGCS